MAGDDKAARDDQDAVDPRILRFVARFDRREYWLAHEELEELWLEERSDGLKGLIQIAAAFVHLERANRHGARRLLTTALAYLQAYPPVWRDFDLDAIRERARRIVESIDAGSPAGGEGLEETFGFALREVFGRSVPAELVDDVELPYRVRRHAEGYSPKRPGARAENDG